MNIHIAQTTALCIGILFASGCKRGEKLLMMGGGGTSNDINTVGGDDTGSPTDAPGDDTGGYPDDPPGGGEPPVLLEVDAVFDEYPGIAWVIETRMTYTDVDNDIDGGKVWMSASIGGEEAEEQLISIDGTGAIHLADEGVVFFAIEVADDSVEVLMDLALKDRAGNISNQLNIQAN
ncbi:MAG: hypothetical protein CL930_14040 [Deltaproteobacteria bacterium]|nr:hypothetical protein [Deltaproteobacteria bacterium]